VADGAPLLHDHQFDVAVSLRAHQRIAAASRDDLRSAAPRAWSRLFQAELAPLTDPTLTMSAKPNGQRGGESQEERRGEEPGALFCQRKITFKVRG
jgi:hypothetical protein